MSRKDWTAFSITYYLYLFDSSLLNRYHLPSKGIGIPRQSNVRSVILKMPRVPAIALIAALI